MSGLVLNKLPGLQRGSFLKHVLRDLLLSVAEEALDDRQELLLPGLGHPVAGAEQSPRGRSHPPAVCILEQTNALLAALWSGVLLGQPLLQDPVVHV